MFLPLLIAAALIPTGFTRSPSLETAASMVAGRPVTVLCTSDYSAWDEAKRLHNVSDQGGEAPSYVWGFYDRVNDFIYIHPNGCRILKLEAKGTKLPDALTLQAGFVTTLAHEAFHAAGERNEGIAECSAIHHAPGLLVRFFHVRPGKQLRSYMKAAWIVHRSEPPAYQTVC